MVFYFHKVNDKGKKEKEESMRKIYSESKVETLKEYGSINLCSWYIRLDVSAYLLCIRKAHSLVFCFRTS